MNIIKKIGILLLFGLMTTVVNAGIIKGDWKVSGDNLSLADTETGIEWLSLTETDGMSILEAQGLLSTTFNGWRLPTRDEVNDLMYNLMGFNSYGVENFTYASRNYSDQALTFVQAFGSTRIRFGKHTSAGLFYDSEHEEILMSGVIHNTASASASTIYEDYFNSEDIEYSYSSYGVFLVSDGGVTLSSIENPELNANNPNATIPEPETISLLGLALMGLSFRRKSKLTRQSS